ncbi:MAG TPA: glycosyltransferase [Burkholderiales bacterium]|nr:glycosyltransferase [Burkholderiales bacterium]
MKTDDFTPRVSVVVPTCGRPVLLQRCLIALRHQRLPAAEYEIIVVDDGWSDDTLALVTRMARESAQTFIRYLRSPSPRGGPAAARNVGWRKAQADVIAFTDDDTVPSRNWLAEGLKAMQAQHAAVTGKVKVPLPPEPTDWELNTAGLDTAEFVTANCFVRRTALELVDGFDERFRRPWREDSDLQFSLLRSGQYIGTAPEALVLHPVRPAPWGVSLKTQKNNFFEALLFKKHPALYRHRIASHGPWSYYFAVFLLGLALIGLIADTESLAGFALLAWATWTAHFTYRRLRHTQRSWRHIAEMLVTSALIPPVAVFWRIAGAFKFRVRFA